MTDPKINLKTKNTHSVPRTPHLSSPHSARSLWPRLAYTNSGPLKLAAPILVPLSRIYGTITGIRRWMYRRELFKSYSFPVPIISVGNISVGGIGKTPFTIYLARLLEKQGFSPAILIRGYKRKSSELILLTQDSFQTHQIEEYGDEATMLFYSTGFPIAIGGDRVQNAKKVLEQTSCNCLILDDGFQHIRLQHDLDFVMLPHNNPLGNGYCLPYGPLRESVQALKHASAVLFNGEVPSSSWLPTSTPVFTGELQWDGLQPFSDWKNQNKANIISIPEFPLRKIVLVSGIGSPQRLENQAKQLEFNVISHSIFSDHHWFKPEEIKKIQQHSEEFPIFLTEKDAVRLLPLQEHALENYPHTYVICAEWRMHDETKFLEWLKTKVRSIECGVR